MSDRRKCPCSSHKDPNWCGYFRAMLDTEREVAVLEVALARADKERRFAKREWVRHLDALGYGMDAFGERVAA